MSDSIPSALEYLVVATNNNGKRAEFQQLLGSLFHVHTMADLALPSPPETGNSFAENAMLKARHAAEASGFVALGDDSGLEVAALNGEPGVRSARYAGEPPDDRKNRALLLHRMTGMPRTQRQARFVCSLAIATPAGIIEVVESTLDGHIAEAERGTGGFGYDSVFELADGPTLAELTTEEKSAVSHRGRAMRLALPLIQNLMRTGRM